MTSNICVLACHTVPTRGTKCPPSGHCTLVITQDLFLARRGTRKPESYGTYTATAMQNKHAARPGALPERQRFTPLFCLGTRSPDDELCPPPAGLMMGAGGSTIAALTSPQSCPLIARKEGFTLIPNLEHILYLTRLFHPFVTCIGLSPQPREV